MMIVMKMIYIFLKFVLQTELIHNIEVIRINYLFNSREWEGEKFYEEYFKQSIVCCTKVVIVHNLFSSRRHWLALSDKKFDYDLLGVFLRISNVSN